MQTSQATILVDKSTASYLVYSPADGIKKALICGFLDDDYPEARQWQLSEYETPDEIDVDSPYFETVNDVLLRQKLLLQAKSAYAIIAN